MKTSSDARRHRWRLPLSSAAQLNKSIVFRYEQAWQFVMYGHRLQRTGLAAFERNGWDVRWDVGVQDGQGGLGSVGFLAASAEEVLDTDRGQRQGLAARVAARWAVIGMDGSLVLVSRCIVGGRVTVPVQRQRHGTGWRGRLSVTLPKLDGAARMPQTGRLALLVSGSGRVFALSTRVTCWYSVQQLMLGPSAMRLQAGGACRPPSMLQSGAHGAKPGRNNGLV